MHWVRVLQKPISRNLNLPDSTCDMPGRFNLPGITFPVRFGAIRLRPVLALAPLQCTALGDFSVQTRTKNVHLRGTGYRPFLNN